MTDSFSTGAGAGFGEAIAKHYAEEGAKTLICDISDEAGERVAASSDALAFQHVDVSKKADWDAAIEKAVKLWGKVDILVNNAGTTYRNKATNDVTEAEFDRVFNVNVKGVYLGCNAFTAQVMKQGTPGAIVNIASVGAHRPRPGLVWYNASKGAIANVSAARRKWEASTLSSHRRRWASRPNTGPRRSASTPSARLPP